MIRAALAGALVAVLAASSAAAARPPAITGTLSQRGLMVIAVATNGKATVARAPAGTFRIRPPTDRVSLHMRRSDGRYAGPIVLASVNRGRRALVGVTAGARLGRITVSARRGYGRVARRPAARWIATTLWARAKGGIPIGARVFGRVRSKPPRAAAPGDRDVDGLPQPLDIDDDGDLVLDNLERRSGARAAQVSGFDTGLTLMNVLPLGSDAINANAGSTVAQSDEALAMTGYLIVSEVAGDTAELDCGQLSYCRAGGTGRVFGYPGQFFEWPRFPECCDPDGDGQGTIARNPSLSRPMAGMFLHHGATTAQMKTGDVLIERVTTRGVETAHPAILQYVFATVPALVSYSDNARDRHAANIVYPVGPNPAPYPVASGPGGDVVVQLRFWRPQRQRITGEAGTGPWTDIGGLTYTVGPQSATAPQIVCSQDTLSQASPELTLPPTGFLGPDGTGRPGGGFRDSAPDRPADPAKRFGFTVNLSRCLSSRGASWAPNQDLTVAFRGIAGNGRDATEMVVRFRRLP